MDYQLAVPETWECILLDPQRWRHRIEKIVNRRFRGTKGTPQLKAAAVDRLCDQAAAAHANGGVEMYLSEQEIGGIPVPSGLVVTACAPPPGESEPDLQAVGIGLGAQGEDVDMVDLPAGPALRHRYQRRPAADDPDGNTLAVTHLDVYVRVPDSRLLLLLSFSTPMEPLADALVELFDAIAGTLQWRR